MKMVLLDSSIFLEDERMDFIRMNCPMAVLTEETKTSEVSELPSAAFIPFSHPSGFILMKSKMASQQNS